MPYLPFAIEVVADNGRFRIRVTESPVGEASTEAASPFTDEEIEQYMQILGRERRVSIMERERTARQLGEQLFDFLISRHPDISEAYARSLDSASRADGLRIRLSVERAGALSRLPWEFLRDPRRDYLALNTHTPLVRYVYQLDNRAPAMISMPLRVLVMISSPQDFPALDVEGEWQRLQEATKTLRDRKLLELERLDEATLIALQRRLRQNKYHVFHYIGHSDFDASLSRGVLIFENEADNTQGQRITGEALSRELSQESTLRLVVMNSCHSARDPGGDVLAGIASGIVARGIPAVVAMQFEITDNAAKAFAEEFYRALSEFLPIDGAMSEARRAIVNRIPGTTEWATPILFMRSREGALFDSTTAPKRITGSTPAVPTPARQNRIPPRLIVAWLATLVAVFIVALLFAAVIPALTPPQPTPTPSALPDLVAGSARFTPRQIAPGQIFIVNITIRNEGEVESGAFNWAWDASVSDPIIANALIGRIESIPAGGSRNLSFLYSYGWWGTYDTQIRVDVDTEVDETNNRNNQGFFEITIDEDLPLTVDFSLLPTTNQPTVPPLPLTPDIFALWNLEFGVVTTGTTCEEVPLQLADVNDDVVVMVDQETVTDACEELPLSTTILRAPVSQAEMTVIPQLDGTATFTYYADTAGTQVVYESPEIAITADEPITLQPPDDEARTIRRIDVATPGQTVRLTRLTLLR